MIRRLFSAPLLSLALLGIWMVLNRDYSLGQWLLGILVALIVPILTNSLRPNPVKIKNLWLAVRLFFLVGYDVIIWNWRVLRGTIATSDKQPQGGFIKVPLDMKDPAGLAVLAAIMCVIPGTIWSEISLDRTALLVHIFDLHDEQQEVNLIKARYERPLMEIFE